jgi:serine protease
MTPTRITAAVFLALSLFGCGGGGDGGTPSDGGTTPTPDPGTPTGNLVLSGTITAASNIVVDTDTNDPDSVYVANDTRATAQAIANPAMVGGFVTATPTFGLSHRYTLTSDPDDVYVVDLVAGQTVALEIADSPSADLDLALYDASGTLLDSSLGVARYETVTAPSSARYYLRVNAYSGRSNYVLTVGSGVLPATAPTLAGDFVPGEAVVRFKPAGVQAAVASLGLEIKAGSAERPMLMNLNGPRVALAESEGLFKPVAGLTVAAASEDKLRTLYRIKALQGRSDVLSADPNYRVKIAKTPNDPYYSLQWHYPLINLPQAWDTTTGTPASGEVVVAVVDTGVFLSHPDISPNLLRDGSNNVVGYDFVSSAVTSNDGDGIDANADDPGDESSPASSSWHGTHVAGTIAAASNNGVGVSGVAWGAKIMPVRVIGKGGGTSYDVLQGVRYAAGLSNDSGRLPTRKADVINLSLGCLNCYVAAEQALFNEVRAAGVIVVAAAGNENTRSLGYPASYDNVVSVSAVAMDRTRAPYSNYGSKIDIAAPGGDTSRDSNADGYADGILSTLVTATRGPDYRFYQGTSMAAPHVAGVAALMKAVHPGLTPGDFDAMLGNGLLTVDLGSAGRDDTYGWGLVDAAKAVLAARNAASGSTSAALSANPGRLDFGASVASGTLEIGKLGSASLNVGGVSDDAAWLTVSAASVDANGLGGYTVSVNRAGLSAGSYSATISISGGDGSTIRVPVSMQVGSTVSQANTGRYYVLLLDANLNLVKQATVEGSAGRYPFRFEGIAAGTYYLYAGTDSDWDDFVCDDAEVCGAYPTVGTPQTFSVSADRANLDFTAGLVASPSTQSADSVTDRFKISRGHVTANKGVRR